MIMSNRLSTKKLIDAFLGRDLQKPAKPSPPKQLSFEEAERLRKKNRGERRMK